MTVHFVEELQQLNDRMLYMSSVVENHFLKAITALRVSDRNLAQQVIDGDDEIDKLELEIDSLCLKLLALQQPMASDLRTIIGILKINNDLERIGDHSANIAKRALRLADYEQVKPPKEVFDMAEMVENMYSDCMLAYTEKNTERALLIRQKDKKIDETENFIIRNLFHTMQKNPKLVPQETDLIIIVKNFERIADYVTNIAEEIIFILQAIQVKHQPQEGASTV